MGWASHCASVTPGGAPSSAGLPFPVPCGGPLNFRIIINAGPKDGARSRSAGTYSMSMITSIFSTPNVGRGEAASPIDSWVAGGRQLTAGGAWVSVEAKRRMALLPVAPPTSPEPRPGGIFPGGAGGGLWQSSVASGGPGPVAGKQTPCASHRRARAGRGGACTGTPGYIGGRQSAGPTRWPGCTSRATPGRVARRAARPCAEDGVGRTLCTHVCSDCGPLCRAGMVSTGGSNRWCTVRTLPATLN